MSELLWTPSIDRISKANITKFISYISEKEKIKLNDYHELYDWSINNIEKFWKCIWDYSGIIHSQKYDTILIDKGIKDSKWFVGSELNFAENLLRFNDDKTALISYRENYQPVRISYR